MKRKVLIAMELAVACIMPSCGKDPIENPETPEPTAETIVFGNYTGMDVMTYDHVDWEYHDDYTSYYWKDFDVNGDGEFDFALCSRKMKSSYQGDIQGLDTLYDVTLHAAPRMEFHSDLQTNEIYSHPDSTIIPTDSIPLIYIEITESCNKVLESDVYKGPYSKYVIQSHYKNDLLNMNDSIFRPLFTPYTLYVSNYQTPYYIDLDDYHPNVFKSNIDGREGCFNLPMNEEIYIGFKYNDESRYRLGWIKIIIEQKTNGFVFVTLLETAIQQ